MIGQTISHYKILEKLGEGGMGVVYKAEDTKLDRFVALKFLPPHLSQDKENKKRFIHEAQAASSLDHPNICTIYEIDETEDRQMFIVMAYYSGESLKKKMECGTLKLEETLDIVSQIILGLNKAHQHGITHRDIKPANIMITDDGVVKIVDFGLAKLTGQSFTKEGAALGTIAYMSPEQTRREGDDHRSDIWSLGVLFYEMITGQLPFRGDYDEVVIYSIANEAPEPITSLQKDVPKKLERIIGRCLSKDSEERYEHVDEIFQDLQKLLKKIRGRDGIQVSDFTYDRAGKDEVRRYFLPAVLVIMLVLAFLIARSLFVEQASGSRPIPIAVLSFENQTGDSTYDYLQNAIPNLLITNLEQLKHLRVITWERMYDLLQETGKAEVEVRAVIHTSGMQKMSPAVSISIVW